MTNGLTYSHSQSSSSSSLMSSAAVSPALSAASSRYPSMVSTPATSIHSDDEYFKGAARSLLPSSSSSFSSTTNSSISSSNEELQNRPPTPDEFFASHTRIPDLWFDDGNLILQAESTLFRVYRGHLAARSSVFSDMFAFPPPAEGNRTVDGVPVVEVYDKAEDMERFLRALLDSSYFEPPPTPTTLPLVASILRLSTKYDVPPLLTRSLSHLLTTYPTTLSAWRARDSTRTIPSIENTPFAAMNLASEFGLVWLVPSIVYCISSHDLAKTLEGAEWKEGTERKDGNEGMERKDGKEGTVEGAEWKEEGEDGRVEMRWVDKKLCVSARNKLLLVQNAHALAIVRHHRPSPPSPSPSPSPNANNANPGDDADGKCRGERIEGGENSCHETRLRIADILTRWGTAGFLDFWEEQYEMFRGLCGVCLDDFK